MPTFLTRIYRDTCSAGILCLVFVGFANAQTTYIGSPECRDWLNPRDVSGVSLEHLRNNAWLVGFLSGVAAGTGKNILAGEDATDLQQKVSQHCRAKPSLAVSEAALYVVIELKRKKGL